MNSTIPRHRLLIALLLLAIPATAVWATSLGEAEAAIAEAKAMRAKAESAGVTDSQAAEMIAEAESLILSRQYTRAMQIAYWALRQDEFAIRLKTDGDAETVRKAAMAEALIAAAEEARTRAAAVGGEWRDVGTMIKDAKTLAGAGELDRAIEVAKAAKFQSERGYEQALEERDADFPSYLFNAAE
jgi:hypothetical protein